VLTSKSEQLKDLAHQSELKLSRQQWQLHQQTELLQANYQFNGTQARIWLKSKDMEGMKSDSLPDLKRQMSELGDVHIGALEEYKRVNERYLFLTHQKEDMLEAKASLEIIISELEQHMIEQFKAQFDKIQVSFKEVFQKLFSRRQYGAGLTESR
jgi:chromosome segregation protein